MSVVGSLSRGFWLYDSCSLTRLLLRSSSSSLGVRCFTVPNKRSLISACFASKSAMILSWKSGNLGLNLSGTLGLTCCWYFISYMRLEIDGNRVRRGWIESGSTVSCCEKFSCIGYAKIWELGFYGVLLLSTSISYMWM